MLRLKLRWFALIVATLALGRPVLANVPIVWGAWAASAPLQAGLGTKGLALIVVLVIEALIYKRLFRLAWLKTLWLTLFLNLASTLLGVLIAAIGFATGGTSPLVLIAAVALAIFCLVRRAPLTHALVGLAATAFGFFGLIQMLDLPPLASPSTVWLGLLKTLTLGFGLTLLLEMAFSARLQKKEDIKPWHGVLLANVASYLFLFLAVPLFPHTPYQGDVLMRARQLEQSIEQGWSPEETARAVRHMRGSNPYLLGLSDDDEPRDGYSAGAELRMIERLGEDHPTHGLALLADLRGLGEVPGAPRHSIEELRARFEAQLREPEEDTASAAAPGSHPARD